MPESREVSAKTSGPVRRPAERFVLLLGRIVALVSILWIGRILWDFDPSSIATRLDRFAATVVIGALAYAAASLCLLEGWVRWLRLFGSDGPSRRHLYVVYGQTQLARYIPGNVVQLASRHLLAARLGIRHSRLVSAMVGEILGLLTAAAWVGAILYRPSTTGATGTGIWTLWALTGGLVLVLVGSSLLLGTRLGRSLGLSELPPLEISRRLLEILGFYALFFFTGGLILLGTTATLAPLPESPAALRILSVFAVSWLAGFLTPGAPAGIGVRELALTGLLTPLLGTNVALAASLSLRLTTVLGDLALFLWVQSLKLPNGD